MRKLKDTERKVFERIYMEDGDTLQSIQESHDNFIEKSSVFPETVELDIEHGWDGESDQYSWVGIREETETEKKRRLAAERQARTKSGERRKAKEAEERREYERLKKKFGA
jgi:hypothetical protein